MKLSLVSALFMVMACMTRTGHAETANVIIGTHILEVEIANTRDKIMTGLSNRTRLKQDEGMLFVYPFKDKHCVKMDKINIPLSLAFINDDLKIIEIANLTPKTTIEYCPSQKIRFALQTKVSWFENNNIMPKTQIIFKKGK